MKIAIIDYGAGNIQSIKFAVQRLGYEAALTSRPDEIQNADKVIFPGVGEASSAMNKLKSSGLHKLIPELKQPVLGICLGMQLMCNFSEENNTEGLKIFNTGVVKFKNDVKIPQIGWNKISNLKTTLFEGIEEGAYMYLVHSYYVPLHKNAISTTYYGIEYASALHKDNFYGVQFHPEKSSKEGSRVLANFLKIK
ncbi:imidazole glycerol phosphate synthase subunit HisH [Leptobacterium sp. I13]|uniref:imidazole glycerol phosphate synthase subunit HisH n=1 Tax=Leptobacterium meishanense TaxID=3128904 RepID=UPI0030ECC0AF